MDPEEIQRRLRACRDDTDELDSWMDEEATRRFSPLKSGKSMLDDIDDRIDHEYAESPVGITAQSSKRFHTIPEE